MGGVLERHIAAICGGRDPHLTALGQRKGRWFERLPSSKRAAEGVGFAREIAAWGRGEMDKVVWALSAQQVWNFGELQELHAPGMIHSLLHLPPSCLALVCKPAVTVLASGQPEGGPTYNTYKCKAQRLTPVCLAHWL